MLKFEELISEDMHPTEIKVLHEIYTMLEKHDNCFFSLGYLAKRIGCSTRTVQRNLDKLLMRGLITKEHRYTDKGKQRSNFYFITKTLCNCADNIKRNISQKREDRKKKSKQLKAQIMEIKREVYRRINSGMSPSSQMDLSTLPDMHKYDHESKYQKEMFKKAKCRMKQLRLAYIC
ncbi:MAG: helix-turn-helix domain-containing protein [Eubacterium sp.]